MATLPPPGLPRICCVSRWLTGDDNPPRRESRAGFSPGEFTQKKITVSAQRPLSHDDYFTPFGTSRAAKSRAGQDHSSDDKEQACVEKISVLGGLDLSSPLPPYCPAVPLTSTTVTFYSGASHAPILRMVYFPLSPRALPVARLRASSNWQRRRAPRAAHCCDGDQSFPPSPLRGLRTGRRWRGGLS